MTKLISWILDFLASRVSKNVSDDIVDNRTDWARIGKEHCLYNEKKDTLLHVDFMFCAGGITHFNFIDKFKIRVAFRIYTAYESVKNGKS